MALASWKGQWKYEKLSVEVELQIPGQIAVIAYCLV